MKITAFNGSPKGISGNTNVMVKAFFKGAQSRGAVVENILLAEKKINHCRGCLYCMASGGQCCIKDDMADLMLKFIESDIVILATPLYVHTVSGMMKTFMDRSFCIGNPRYELGEKGEYRGEKSKHFINGIPPKVVAISNAGRPDRSNFHILSQLMKKFTRDFHMDLIAEIYTTEGGLLTSGVPQLDGIINGYKQLLYKAGQEIVLHLSLSEDTKIALQKNFIPADIYAEQVNKHFEKLKRNQLHK